MFGTVEPMFSSAELMFRIIAIAKLNKFLPKDLGRQFAVEGQLSAGKPRGAGIIFIFTFVISAVLFSQINAEIAIYNLNNLMLRPKNRTFSY